MHKGIIRNFYGISAARFTLSLFLLWLSINTEVVAQNFWEPTNGPYGGRINAIAIDHVGQIFLGTDGAGVFSSTTNGANWSAMNKGFLGTVDVRALAMKGDTIFAGLNNIVGLYNFAGLGNGGIYRSTNAGKDWAMPDARLLGIAIRAIAVNSVGHLFAGTKDDGVFRSTNNGNSWEKINQGLVNLDINALAVNRDTILAGAAMGVFRSTDEGESWKHITAGLDSINVSALAVNSSQHIFVGAKGRGIFRSKDHGKTWVQINNGLTNLNIQALAINSNGHIFAGTDGGGVFRSIDDEQNWEHVKVGLKDTTVLSLAISKTEDVFAGTFSRGVFRTTNNGASWAEVNNGLTAFVVLRFIFNSQGDIFAATGGGGVYRSSDLGESWEQANTGLENLFVTSFAITKTGDIFAGTAIGVFRSTDHGARWTKATAASDNIVVSALTAKNDTIFAGTVDSNGVLISTDNGETWEKTGANLRATSILSLAFNDSDHIFAGTVRDGIFRSTNNGVSWSNVIKHPIPSFPPLPVFSLATNSLNAVFAGIFGGGVIRSMDNGNTWTSANRGLSNILITSLAIDSQDDILAGTIGAGVYRSDDSGENWTSSDLGLPPNSIVTALAINSNNQIFAAIAGERVFRGVKPAIAHTPFARRVSEQPIPIQARITDASDVAGATLNYRRGGEANFIALPMSASVDSFKATIPADYVTSRGVEYFISATNANGITNRNPSSGIFSIQIQVKDVIKSTAQPHGNAQNAYRLISVPLEVENKDARAVLEDDLGQYRKSRWRFYELQADQNYAELPDILPIMAPGKAFWLIVKDADKIIDTGPGVSNATDKPYAIALYPKWTFVANPFNFSIPVNKLHLKSSGRPPVLRSYIGSWSPISAQIMVMEPFEGYAVSNNSPNMDTLFVDTNLSTSASSFPKASFVNNSQIEWSICILAQCQEAGDVDNLAAIVSSASNTWDELDQPEPPVIGEYVSVYFPHREWNTLAKTYCLDTRPEPTEGETWDFEVKTNIRDKVNLSFEGIASVPSEFEVWLVDEALQITQNLRESPAYSVAGSEQPKALKLVVGRREFITQQLAEIDLVPATYELSQNFPNPFNPVTTIRYGLPQAERVSLKIYNLLGEEVATLVNDEQKAAGYHVAIWDGRGKNGNVAASGVYVYRVQAGGFVSAKKLAIVK